MWDDYVLADTEIIEGVISFASCVGSCTICDFDTLTCFGDVNPLIFDIDLETDSQTISDLSGNSLDFFLGTDATSEDEDPLLIPFQGYRFSRNTFMTLDSLTSVNLPPIFSLEAWIRFDHTDMRVDNQIQYLFEKGSLYFGVTNEELVAQIGTKQVLSQVAWFSADEWYYVAVSFKKTYYNENSMSGTTAVTLFWNTQIIKEDTVTTFIDDDESDLPVIGRGFFGVIRRLRLYRGDFCG
jgi:hypothetical protein